MRISGDRRLPVVVADRPERDLHDSLPVGHEVGGSNAGVSRMGGPVPPMFRLLDPEGNVLLVAEVR